MSIELTGETAFDNVMERLLEEREVTVRVRQELAEMRDLAESRRLEVTSAKLAQQCAETDLKTVRENYEKLKMATPPKLLAEHEKAIDDVPF